MKPLLPAKTMMDMLAKKVVYVHLEMNSWSLIDNRHVTLYPVPTPCTLVLYKCIYMWKVAQSRINWWAA